MGKVTIRIESVKLTSKEIADICDHNLGALVASLELNAGDADKVSTSIGVGNDHEDNA